MNSIKQQLMLRYVAHLSKHLAKSLGITQDEAQALLMQELCKLTQRNRNYTKLEFVFLLHEAVCKVSRQSQLNE